MKRQGIRALLLLAVVGLIVGLSGCAKTIETPRTGPPDCEKQIALLQVEIHELAATIQGLEEKNAELKAEVKELEERLAECEADKVYVTKFGEKYHKRECRYVANKDCVIPISKELARRCEYEPCSVCEPQPEGE